MREKLLWNVCNIGLIHEQRHNKVCSILHCTLHLYFSQSFGAGDRNRTCNLLITNQLLCQLSYASTAKKSLGCI